MAAPPPELSPDRSVIDKMNRTRVEYPQNTCLHQLIEERVKVDPSRVAVRAEGGTLTYGELNERSNRVARHLRALGVGPDVLVAICVERSLEMVVGLLSILKAGGAYVPIDPSYPKERLAVMIEDARASVLLVHGSTEALLPEAPSTRVNLDDLATFAGAGGADLELHASARNLAYVIFTSGSTGRPKGAMNEHRAIVNRLLWMRDEYHIGPSQRILQKTPFSFDVSVWELFLPLLTGAELVMARPGGHKDGRYLVDTIRAHRITTLHFVPSMLRMFLTEGDVGSCTSLEAVMCSGEALPPQVVDQLHGKLPQAELHNLYGPTEAAVDVTCWHCPRGAPTHTVPIGRPVANTQIHVVDERMSPCPVGVAGELLIGGIQVGRGYYGRPELTQERFVTDPFSEDPEARLYRTGDLARVRPEGVVEYLGRIDFQVKLRGFRIELGDIEAALSSHPDVAFAVVLLRTDREDDPRLVAYLVPRGESRPTAAVRALVQESLPEFMVPSAFAWLTELPLNPSGKLDRKALPAPASERPDLGRPPTPPRGARENHLVGIFSEILGIEGIGAEDGFFELGGNSLLAMKTIARLREVLSVDVPVARFFQHSTARGLDRFLSDDRSTSERARTLHRVDAAHAVGHEDSIAIVGMAGRFPGANSVDELWENVKQGRASITRFTDAELDPSLSPDLVADPAYVKARGIIEDFDAFDAGFFGVNPREARLLDPQQRLLLECAWEALESAGYVPETVQGDVGVFAGMFGNTYLTRNLLSHPELEDTLGPFAILVQNEKDYAATRVAHKLDLRGPAVSIHTACSTSLVAVTEAFWSLRTRQCDMALAGAASLTCPPRSGYVYVEGGMLSPDGNTRSFDADAQGTTFNDGVAMVVLKRLSDARRDGDTIHAIIRGAAINNDGAYKASFTAPSIAGQAQVIRRALAVAGVDPRTIGYVEAHGTATPIGDPIEIEALTEAFRDHTADVQFCAVSSIKSNIGHLVAASGAAGLMKAALSLRDACIPPTAHFSRPNPKIDFEKTPFFVARELSPFPRTDHPRRASVSSFGVGGTNAHVVLEEAPEPIASTPSPRPAELLVLSARTEPALERLTARMGAAISRLSGTEVADAAFTLARGRRELPVRRFAVIPNGGDAKPDLGDPSALATRTWDGQRPSVAFLFPGQGSQHPNMGRGLYTHDPAFKAVVDRCSELLLPGLGRDLRELLYPAEGAEADAAEVLRNTAFTQPALFVIEYATAEVLLGWGVKPGAMAGHSVGELVAAVVSGVMPLESALLLVAARGRLIQALPPGSMLSVRLPAADLSQRLPPGVTVASDNGPSLCVASGPAPAVRELEARLTEAGVVCKALVTSHAFHSEMMDPAVLPFLELVRKVPLGKPRIPFVSTLTGTWITDEEAQDPRYWARHLRGTVRFREAAAELLREKTRAFVEVGPRTTLSTLVRQQATDPRKLLSVPTLGDSGNVLGEWRSLLSAVGQLYLAGQPVDWETYFAGERRQRKPLPTYPFEHTRYYIEPSRSAHPGHTGGAAAILDGPRDTSTGAGAAGAANASEAAHSVAAPSDLHMLFEQLSGLSLTEADRKRTFLDLGLDSLLLTQIAQQLQKRLGKKVTLRDLLETYPTFDALTALGDGKNARGAAGSPAAAPGVTTEPQKARHTPPAPGARLGRDPDGNPAWYVPDPDRPGQYIKLP